MIPRSAILVLGVAQAVVYGFVLWLSHRFIPGRGFTDRPIVAVSVLFAVAFVLYLISLALAVGWQRGEAREANRSGSSEGLLATILIFAALFRGILWWSSPIQEIDIYRYLWDGRVLVAGVNPYRFSPEDVENYREGEKAPEALRRLATLRNSSPALAILFQRIHFREVPTVYPPGSQLVFAAVAWIPPAEAPLTVHLGILKGVLLLFDAGTVLLLWALLSRFGLPVGWVLAYAWCPLVMKEFANSGHLDSIAVCLTILSVLLLLPERERAKGTATDFFHRATHGELMRQGLAACVWAAATLAKLYPVLLLPVFVRWWYRRLGWRAGFPLALYVAVLVAAYLPLFLSANAAPEGAEGVSLEAAPSEPEVPVPASGPIHHDPFEGLRTFLGRWEMNDLIFAVVIENLKPPGPPEPSARQPAKVWFAVVPTQWRIGLEAGLARRLDRLGFEVERIDLPWMLARVLTGGMLVMICCWLALRPWPGEGSKQLVEGVFLSLAWLWFLSPTQNPWYWTWALPFVAFGARSWLLVSGLSLIYYLRFFLLYHFEEQTIAATGYVGTEFFDFVVVWFEHVPVLVLLLVETVLRRRGVAGQGRNEPR